MIGRKILFFPLSIEMAAIDDEHIFLRWYPDEALMPSFLKQVSEMEQGALKRYREATQMEGFPEHGPKGIAEKHLKAWVRFCNEVTIERAWTLLKFGVEKVEKYAAPNSRKLDELEYIEREGIDLTPYLPDKIFVYIKTSNDVKPISLEYGSNPVEVKKHAKSILLSTDEKISAWTIDFKKALELGLGTIVKTSDLENQNWLFVFGLNEYSAKEPQVLEKLIFGKMSTGDFGIISQDAPTNNIQERTNYTPYERDPVSFLERISFKAKGQTDAQVLSKALLGKEKSDFFEKTQGSDSIDQLRYNLFKDLIFELADEFYKEILDFDAHSREGGRGERQSYRDHLTPIGPLPTVRLGRQPYGVLPLSPIDTANDRGFNPLLQKARIEVDRLTIDGQEIYEQWFNAILKQARIPTNFGGSSLVFDNESLEFRGSEKFGNRQVVFDDDLPIIREWFKGDLKTKPYTKKEPSLFSHIFNYAHSKLSKDDKDPIWELLEKFKTLVLVLDTNKEQLKVLLMETLDLFHSRFDSWYLMRANYALKNVAPDLPAMIGAYGWVEAPGRPRSDDDGNWWPGSSEEQDKSFTIGPSEIQAAVAHLVQNTGVEEKDYQLDSKFIQLALRYHAGLKKGSLNDAVLGQILEQLMREEEERGRKSVSYQEIIELRQEFPLVGEEGPSGNESKNAQQLSWQKFSEKHKDSVKYKGYINDITATVDTLSQLLRLQSLYDLVQSNTSKVNSLQSFLEGNGRIPDLDFIKTHRTGEHQRRSIHVNYVGNKDYLDFSVYPTAFLSPIVQVLYNRHLMKVTHFATFTGISGRASVPQPNYGLHLSQAIYFGEEYLRTFLAHIIHDDRLFDELAEVPSDWMSQLEITTRQERMKFPYAQSMEHIQKSIGGTKVDTIVEMIRQDSFETPTGFIVDWKASVEQQANKALSLHNVVNLIYEDLKVIKEGIDSRILKEEKLVILINNITENQTKIDLCRLVEGIDHHVDDHLICDQINEMSLPEDAFELWASKEPEDVFGRPDKLKLKAILEQFQKITIWDEINALIKVINYRRLRSTCFDMGLIEINTVLKKIRSREALTKKISALEVLMGKTMKMKEYCLAYLTTLHSAPENWSSGLQSKLRKLFSDPDENTLDSLSPRQDPAKTSLKELFVSYYTLLDDFFEERVFPTLSFVGETNISFNIQELKEDKKDLLFKKYPYVIKRLKHYLKLEQNADVISVREVGESIAYEFNKGENGRHLNSIRIDQWNDFIPKNEEHIGIAVNAKEPPQEAPNLLLLAVPPYENYNWDPKSLADCISNSIDLMRIRMLSNESITNDPELGIHPLIFLPPFN